MNKTTLNITLAAVLGTAALGAQAATLQTGDFLSINAGVPVYDSNGYLMNVTSGSYFSFEYHGDSRLRNYQKTPMVPAWDRGIVIGVTQPPGAIDTQPYWNTIAGHYTTSPVTGGTTSGLDFSGWNIDWWGLSTPLGSGSWVPINCASFGIPCTGYSNGVARFDWNGIYGNSYTLDYAATVPLEDPSYFGGVHYFIHLEGTVGPVGEGDGFVPVPAAAWLFGSGLFGLLAWRRVRK